MITTALGTTYGAGQNGLMHANRILLPMLIVASLAIDLAFVASLPGRSVRWPDVFVAVTLGLAGGQINLATLWGVLGYRHLPSRLAVLVVVPFGWGFAMAASAPEILPDLDYDQVATWGVHFLTQTALLASILILVRLRGAVLLAPGLATGDQALPRGQFTLWTLFAWLTATAVVLSALKTTFDHAKLATTTFEWSHILILGFVGAMIGLASFWLILDTSSRSRRIAATWATAIPVVISFAVMALMVRSDLFVTVFLLWLVAGLYSGIAWFVLRVAGCQLVWSKATA